MLPAPMHSQKYIHNRESPEECCNLLPLILELMATTFNMHIIMALYGWGTVCIPFANLNNTESFTLLIYLLHMFTLIQEAMQWQVRQEWKGVSAGAWHAVQIKLNRQQLTALSCSDFGITDWLTETMNSTFTLGLKASADFDSSLENSFALPFSTSC